MILTICSEVNLNVFLHISFLSFDFNESLVVSNSSSESVEL